MTDRQPGAGPLVRAAALNNAEWCAAMCRSHRQAPDGGGTFAAGLWSSDGRPPPLYPDVVTLAPRVTAAGVAARLGTGPGPAPASASVKDSFAVLDLTGDGFVRLFDAQWIVRMPGTSPTAARPPGVRWDVVGTAEGLAAWADAWDGGEGLAGLFRPELLREPDVAVLAGRSLSDGRVVAGAVANRSGGDSGAEVVGLSNVFSAVGDPYTAWAGALAAAERVWPLPLPVVGYEHPGDDLDAALAVGFHPIGPLTVWLRRTPGSAGGTP